MELFSFKSSMPCRTLWCERKFWCCLLHYNPLLCLYASLFICLFMGLKWVKCHLTQWPFFVCLIVFYTTSFWNLSLAQYSSCSFWLTEQEMTLEEYEKVREEKRKALLAMKSEERKVEFDEDLQSMKQLSVKKDNNEIFIKLVEVLFTFYKIDNFMQVWWQLIQCLFAGYW